MANAYEIDGFRALDCQCPHRLELLIEPEEQAGVTIWRHGKNGEAAMVVTPEMRREWSGCEGRRAKHWTGAPPSTRSGRGARSARRMMATT